MQPNIFYQSIPEPYRIFGARLLPFSLGRYRLLKRFECAFVEEGEARATIDDLVLGVLVCSMKVREFLELLQDEEGFRRELKRWGKRIRAEIAADPHFNIFAKFGLFKKYLHDGNQVPKFWDETESPGSSPAHWSHAVEVALRSQVGYSVQEIDETPLSKALADYFQWAQSEGLVRIMTDEEAAMKQAEGEANLKALMACLDAAGMKPEDMASVGKMVQAGEVTCQG